MWTAIKADTLSMVSFQLGLFGYMALYHLVFSASAAERRQPGLLVHDEVRLHAGFFTARPVNAWLIRRGGKEKM